MNSANRRLVAREASFVRVLVNGAFPPGCVLWVRGQWYMSEGWNTGCQWGLVLLSTQQHAHRSQSHTPLAGCPIHCRGSIPNKQPLYGLHLDTGACIPLPVVTIFEVRKLSLSLSLWLAFSPPTHFERWVYRRRESKQLLPLQKTLVNKTLELRIDLKRPGFLCCQYPVWSCLHAVIIFLVRVLGVTLSLKCSACNS